MATTYRRILNWASENGSLVLNSAGNDSYDLDHLRNWIKLPGECSNGIMVAATAPIGQQNFGTPTSYTNYGKSAISVSAPGGDVMDYPNDGWWNDLMFSTSVGGWEYMMGTSQATPVVAGVAALVISKYGKMTPGELRNHLAQTADDLGKKGRDAYHGRGQVNAYKAVTK
ncbi:MAG: S8 family serine peptidase [bacterium]|nr:S8 family serine peptidase [bacterium]